MTLDVDQIEEMSTPSDLTDPLTLHPQSSNTELFPKKWISRGTLLQQIVGLWAVAGDHCCPQCGTYLIATISNVEKNAY